MPSGSLLHEERLYNATAVLLVQWGSSDRKGAVAVVAQNYMLPSCYKATRVVLRAEEQVWEIPTITVCHTSSSFYLRRETRQIQEQIQNWFQDRIQHWFKSGSGKQLGTICIHLLKATIYWIHQPVPNLYFAFCILLCVTAWKVNTVLTIQEFNQIQNVCVCVLYQPMKSTQYRLQWAKTQ